MGSDYFRRRVWFLRKRIGLFEKNKSKFCKIKRKYIKSRDGTTSSPFNPEHIKMKAAFIINDFETMNLEKDTSIFLIKEAQRNHIDTYAFDTSDILVEVPIKATVNEVSFKANSGYDIA